MTELQNTLYRSGFAAAVLGLFLMSGCVSDYYFADTQNSSSTDSTSGGSTSGGSNPGGGTTAGGSPGAGPTAAPTLPPSVQPNGILNGHFDVDTATGATPFPVSNGSVSYHVHEYDKINKTTTVDFFNLINAGGETVSGTEFDQVGATVAPAQRFYLTIVNSALNPGGVLEINGTTVRVTDYQSAVATQLAAGIKPQVYTIGAPQVAGDMQLKALKIGFDSKVDAVKLLIPTAPESCVFPNIPGAKGEYRDGALVVQVTNVNDLSLGASTNAQANNGGLLWEGIIYNHYMLVDSSGNETDPETCYSATFF